MRSLGFACMALILSVVVSTGHQTDADTVPAVLPLDESSLVGELQKSRGRILLVNVWATWCVPCVEEFPDLLKVRRLYADRGLDVVLISVDNPRRIRRDVHPFLKRMNVTFPTYIKQTRADETFMNVLSPRWSGALPATFIFDREGKLVHAVVDATTFDELSSAIEPLLAQ